MFYLIIRVLTPEVSCPKNLDHNVSKVKLVIVTFSMTVKSEGSASTVPTEIVGP